MERAEQLIARIESVLPQPWVRPIGRSPSPGATASAAAATARWNLCAMWRPCSWLI